MENSIDPSTPVTHRIVAFLLYLGGGLLIFLFGSNTFSLFATNRNMLYEWGLTLSLLLLSVILQRVPRLQAYVKISGALFIAAFANALNLALGDFLGRLLHLTNLDMRTITVDKLSQAIPIILAVILLSLWYGDDLGVLFLKRGNLRQGLRFGLISYAAFALIFAGSLLLQSNSPARSGLFASGFSVKTILPAIPWILVFCFANSLMEELIFRGISLRKLTPLLGNTLAVLVTALVFGATHIGATYITPLEMFIFPVIVFILGLVNATVMLKTDSIWGSVLFHAGYDLMVILPVLSSLQ